MSLDLQAIKRRIDALDPDAWSTEEPGPYVHNIHATDPEGRAYYVAKWLAPKVARFIAHARTDVPALVAEVERLRADAVVGGLTAPPTPAPEHSCQWCEINTNHPKCPTNADYLEACPHCGCDPEDVTLHAAGCPTLGTCASTYPDLPKPWHPEPEVDADWRAWHDEHMRTVHPR